MIYRGKYFVNKIKMPTEVQTLQTLERKPSSPREFFERLYGHLESKKDDDTKKLDSTSEVQPCSLPKCEESGDESAYNTETVDHAQISDHRPEIGVNDPLVPVKRNLFNEHPLILRDNLETSTRSTFFPTQFSGGFQPYVPVDKSNLLRFPHFGDRAKKKRPRRQRTTFSNEQTNKLELEYSRGEYISRGRRFQLANSLRLTETQIKIWFQNRRAKDKRIEKAQQDQYCRLKCLERYIGCRGNIDNINSLSWYDLHRIYIQQNTEQTPSLWDNGNVSSVDYPPRCHSKYSENSDNPPNNSDCMT